MLINIAADQKKLPVFHKFMAKKLEEDGNGNILMVRRLHASTPLPQMPARWIRWY